MDSDDRMFAIFWTAVATMVVACVAGQWCIFGFGAIAAVALSEARK